MSEIWFTSDTHFGHTNIIEYCERPFKDAQHMNQMLLARWNERVGNGDTVYHLGDFGMLRQERATEMLLCLNGTKHLVKGNHDKGSWLESFASCQDYLELNHHKRLYILMHYPMLSWKGSRRGSFMLHGHRHTREQQNHPARLDVGVDGNNYYPWHIDEVSEHFKQAMVKP